MSSDQVQLKDLLQIIEIICSNIGYSRFIEEEMLIDYRTYFDICHFIFQELAIKIIKIQQNKKITKGQKMQQLIDLLGEELQLEDFGISGQEIINGNPEHIHMLLEILYEYSKIYMNSRKPTNAVKSAPQKNKIMKEKEIPVVHRSSARQPRRVNDSNDNDNDNNDEEEEDESTHKEAKNSSKEEEEEEASYLIQEKPKKRKAHYSANAKRARSHQQMKKNLHLDVVHKIVGVKTKILRAASRDNRKSRLQSIKLAKNSYKIFLQRYAKENIAANGKKKIMKEKSTAKPISQELPLKDFEQIDNFFQSFAYKFRDKKVTYLRRIQKLVHQQQLDRFCYQNRLDRQLKKYMNERLEADLTSQMHQHRVRSQVLKENTKILEESGTIIKKDIKMRDSQLKKEFKMAKKDELNKIENAIREDNDKMLMSLEEGGRLEQIIMKMYKRF